MDNVRPRSVSLDELDAVAIRAHSDAVLGRLYAAINPGTVECPVSAEEAEGTLHACLRLTGYIYAKTRAMPLEALPGLHLATMSAMDKYHKAQRGN